MNNPQFTPGCWLWSTDLQRPGIYLGLSTHGSIRIFDGKTENISIVSQDRVSPIMPQTSDEWLSKQHYGSFDMMMDARAAYEAGQQSIVTSGNPCPPCKEEVQDDISGGLARGVTKKWLASHLAEDEGHNIRAFYQWVKDRELQEVLSATIEEPQPPVATETAESAVSELKAEEAKPTPKPDCPCWNRGGEMALGLGWDNNRGSVPKMAAAFAGGSDCTCKEPKPEAVQEEPQPIVIKHVWGVDDQASLSGLIRNAICDSLKCGDRVKVTVEKVTP